MKLLVQDPNGYFIPDIRRKNFALNQNGIPLLVADCATASAVTHAQSNEEESQ